MNRIQIVFFSFCLSLLVGCAGQPELHNHDDSSRMVRVRIVHTVATLNLDVGDGWQFAAGVKVPAGAVQIRQQAGHLLYRFKDQQWLMAGQQITFSAIKRGTELSIRQVPYGIGWWWAGSEGRRYQGTLHIHTQADGKPLAVLELPLEEYLLGVVPYEIGPDAPLEALKAQAVAARSEAMVALQSGLYSGPHFDLTSDVECQVFSGNQRRSADSDRAVRETSGLVLKENKKVIHAYYASNCGGHSETIQNVWPDRPAVASYQYGQSDAEEPQRRNLGTNSAAREWIDSRPAVYCNPQHTEGLPGWSATNFRWQRTYSTDSLTAMISKNEGRLLVFNVLGRGVSGRATKVELVFENGYRQVEGELTIRQLFHPPLRSACFVVHKKQSQFVFDGAGWGHGVGMCQSGAVGRALDGQNFKAILKHYYPAAEVAPKAD